MDWLNNYCWIETFSKKHLCETYLLIYGSRLLFVSLLNSTHRTVLLENLFIVTSGTTCSFFSPSMFYVTEGVNMKKGSICFFIQQHLGPFSFYPVDMLPFYISSPPNFVSNTSSQVYIVNVFYHLCPQPCPHRPFPTNHVVMVIVSFFASLFFLAFDFFVSSAWSLFFFIPTTMANDLRLQRISIPDLIHLNS